MADSQPQQASGGQQAQQLLRPDDILKLQCLPDDEKQKYRLIMQNFWTICNQHQQGSPENTNARQKLAEWSQKFITRERSFRAKMKAQQQQRNQNQGQAGQSNATGQQNQNAAKQEGAQALNRGADGVAGPANQQNQGQQPPAQGQNPGRGQVDPAIIKHVQEFPMQGPMNGPAPGTPEYEAKIKEYRTGYLNMLAKQASLGDNRRKLLQQLSDRQAKGEEIPQELLLMRAKFEKEHATMASQIEKFRSMQKSWKEEPPHSQTMPANQMPQFAQGQQQQNFHQQQRPQINPMQANQHQQSHSPHPQSATSNAPGPPVPLSHQAAVSAANRSYTDPQRTNTPMQQGGQGGNFGNREREQLNNPKMPIPRHLNVAQPLPVHMGQARPTMGGPTNGAPGPMGQPVIPRPPPFQLEGEGDRVLSKRKLDELVRQVTGGSEEALTPEAEEAVLQLADDFVDNLISNACKLSKLRDSPQLDIRDIQVILERNYNIRIPGYASDEVRTVRKIVPAQGWAAKMNAVNAAKVMGGKTDF
ncbi:Transcription initiation factor TFIID protein [Pyrenophora tritici-repentis]|uniref:TAF61, Transcription initiation factor TFIID n=1 Tax=Pyrenophora tritici-repentis TaxID=45151 RepID=A0A2W1GZB1_9PLEO|nr:Transcription initiation factor TFIID subunit 12 [Pyrenophora tritici-repentis]KAF7455150.1 Transcription initiation factor TFIID protein [Pyrenophora tritici-repentis]KAF7578312.1 TAF61, Transcription initiation factor TFIID [Pyrenophora tritici-repentis]KAG9388903.1 Transcription initiation factor TFIID protein [Pyrenophora tritici-repentis]KAI0575871.1 Transcription initiation factor TFIID subunit 12 [Pyrenophora tritici-repentis]